MNQQDINTIVSILSATFISVVAYFGSRRAAKKETKVAKQAVEESTKSYVDKYIGQLEARITECTTRAEIAVAEANAAKAEVILLNLRTTDLEEQLVKLAQQIVRTEGERDTAIAEGLTNKDILDAQSHVEPR